MRHSETIRRQSGGFTLIELIVVIGIITILASLLLAAITKVRDAGPRVRTKDEIGQMSLAVENFKATYQVQYVPTCLYLTNNYNAAPTSQILVDSRQYMSRVWPKATWGGGNVALDGNQVLVFLLGGMQQKGFYNSPNQPFQVPADGTVAKGPFFDFKAERLDAQNHYHDFYWDGQTADRSIYYYFSSNAGSDYDYFGKKYYYIAPDGSQNPDPVANQFPGVKREGGYGNPNADPTLNTVIAPLRGLDGRFLNPNGFQIISPGKDRHPGRGSPCNPNAWTPNNVPWPQRICPPGQYTLFDAGTADYSPGNVGGDDLSNFARGMLGAE